MGPDPNGFKQEGISDEVTDLDDGEPNVNEKENRKENDQIAANSKTLKTEPNEAVENVTSTTTTTTTTTIKNESAEPVKTEDKNSSECDRISQNNEEKVIISAFLFLSFYLKYKPSKNIFLVNWQSLLCDF